MLSNRNITAADATVTVYVDELYPQGFQLQQFSTDTMATQNEDVFSETRMGVDGQMVAGYVDQIKSVSVVLEPSSPSIQYLETVAQAMRTNRKTYQITMLVNIPAVGKVYSYINGVLKVGKLLPDIKRVLDPVTYSFDFEQIQII